MSRMIDLTGNVYGRLTVLQRDSEGESNYKDKSSRWLCQCTCGKVKSVSSPKLRSGNTSSCGCLNSQLVKERSKKYNSYNLTGEFGVGYTSSGIEFYFDLEDYEKIKEHCWYKNNNDYIVAHIDGKTALLHRFVMEPKEHELVDHVYGRKFDNRKSELRFATKAQNCQNSKTRSDNTSGRTGVRMDEQSGKWMYSIHFNNNREVVRGFETFEEASKARELAEDKYHKEFKFKGDR